MSANSKFRQFGFAARAVRAGNAIDLSAGIEDADDMIADLRQAMEQVELP